MDEERQPGQLWGRVSRVGTGHWTDAISISETRAYQQFQRQKGCGEPMGLNQ